MLNLVFLLISFVPLVYGANLLVDSASSLAKRLNIPNIVIGLTIVAFGTSAPELTVNLFASISGNPNITLGNIIGSNIFNILGIAGIAAMIYPLTVKNKTTWIEIPLCLLSALVLLVMANDIMIDKSGTAVIGRIDGILLLFFFVIFISYNIQMMLSGSFEEEITVKHYSIKLSVLLIITGFALLVIGGRLIVMFAVELAEALGVSERIIALTIVSIGTSLPELATSVIAARKKNVDIAIGNVVGSNIFNAFFILGLSAVINPVPLKSGSYFDLWINLAASALLFIFIFTGKGRKIDRWEGAVFVAIYSGYLIALIF